MLTEHGIKIAPSTYYAAQQQESSPVSAAALADAYAANAVFDLMRDHEGGLWFALREAGIARLTPQWRNFALFTGCARSGTPLNVLVIGGAVTRWRG